MMPPNRLRSRNHSGKNHVGQPTRVADSERAFCRTFDELQCDAAGETGVDQSSGNHECGDHEPHGGVGVSGQGLSDLSDPVAAVRVTASNTGLAGHGWVMDPTIVAAENAEEPPAFRLNRIRLGMTKTTTSRRAPEKPSPRHIRAWSRAGMTGGATGGWPAVIR